MNVGDVTRRWCRILLIGKSLPLSIFSSSTSEKLTPPVVITPAAASAASFDVYNIETALPVIDLEALEIHLKAAKIAEDQWVSIYFVKLIKMRFTFAVPPRD